MLPRRILAQLDYLRDEEPSVRVEAIERLRHWVDPTITQAFCAALRDPDPSVRLAAIAAVRQRREVACLEALRRGLHDHEAPVRTATALALAALQDSAALPDLRPLLDDPATRSAGLRALAALGDKEAIEPLAHLLGTDDLSTDALLHTLGDLAAMHDPRLVMPVIGLLNDADGLVRRSAAITLGEMGHTAAFHALVEVANDEEDDLLAQAALVALGRLKDPRAVPILFEFVTEGADDETRCIAIEALLEVGNAPIFELLRGIVEEDPAEWVRQAAAHALGKLGDPRAYAVLIEALADESDIVQGAAATALADVGDSRAVEPLCAFVGVLRGGLRGLMGHQNVQARIEALQALLRFNDPRADPVIESWFKHGNAEMRFEAAAALTTRGDERGIQHLIDALWGNLPPLASQAVQRLSKLTHPDAAEAVAEWEEGHPYWRIEMVADEDE